ncbi:hypothetical protein MtrunA17_Chr3g0102141 [Medicago truncatula]|uniref:Uncharacterized protein n=1 Tax=Medicago truncatula TaxID=3880 RepID=A0A396IP75_MEDTR|nr:hypothetical protein MtrunA17_Chr3g0102141 [Medicago truncatula]
MNQEDMQRKARQGELGASKRQIKSESTKFRIFKACHSKTWRGRSDKARHSEQEARTRRGKSESSYFQKSLA